MSQKLLKCFNNPHHDCRLIGIKKIVGLLPVHHAVKTSVWNVFPLPTGTPEFVFFLSVFQSPPWVMAWGCNTQLNYTQEGYDTLPSQFRR